MSIVPILLSLAAVFASSCGSRGGGSADSYDYAPPVFKKERNAELVRLNDDMMFSIPMNMFLYDDVAVLKARSVDNENVFQVLSLVDGRQVTSFGVAGRGGNEIEDYGRISVDVEKGMLYAMSNGSKFMRADLRRAVAGDPKFVEDCYNLSGRNTTLTFHAFGDKMLHTEAVPRFFITDLYAADTLARCAEYPKVTRELDADPTRSKLYFGYCATSAVKPDGRKFVSVTNFGMLMEIYDIARDGIIPSIVRRFHKPEMQTVNCGTDDCVMGAYVQAVTDKYIYTIYFDATYGECINGACPSVAVFDWDGNPVAKYSSKDKIIRIAVTPDDRRVYCWVQDADAEEYFGYFDLK